MRGRLLAWVVQVAAVNGQDVRGPETVRDPLTHRPGRDHEVSIHDVEAVAGAAQAARAPGRRRQVAEHGRHACHCEFFPQQHGRSLDPDSIFDRLRGQSERLRRQHRHLVALGEFACQRRHDRAATAAERRVLIVAEENPQDLSAPRVRVCRARSGTLCRATPQIACHAHDGRLQSGGATQDMSQP